MAVLMETKPLAVPRSILHFLPDHDLLLHNPLSYNETLA